MLCCPRYFARWAYDRRAVALLYTCAGLCLCRCFSLLHSKVSSRENKVCIACCDLFLLQHFDSMVFSSISHMMQLICVAWLGSCGERGRLLSVQESALEKGLEPPAVASAKHGSRQCDLCSLEVPHAAQEAILREVTKHMAQINYIPASLLCSQTVQNKSKSAQNESMHTQSQSVDALEQCRAHLSCMSDHSVFTCSAPRSLRKPNRCRRTARQRQRAPSSRT